MVFAISCVVILLQIKPEKDKKYDARRQKQDALEESFSGLHLNNELHLILLSR